MATSTPAQQTQPASPDQRDPRDNEGDTPTPVASAASAFGQREADNRPPLFPDDIPDNTSLPSIPSDARSDQLSSPTNEAVPPYWSQPQDSQTQGVLPPGRARAASSASAESDMPGGITLQDNEQEYDDDDHAEDTRRAAQLQHGRDRNRACWARSVEVTDYVLVNSGATNIGAFVVWNIRVETMNGTKMNIRKRYSEFDVLRRRLIQTFPNFEAAVPALPPKSVLKRFQPRFLEKRRVGLQYFLK